MWYTLFSSTGARIFGVVALMLCGIGGIITHQDDISLASITGIVTLAASGSAAQKKE